MQQMLSEGNLSWCIATLSFILNFLTLENSIFPEQLVTIKPRNKRRRLVG